MGRSQVAHRTEIPTPQVNPSKAAITISMIWSNKMGQIQLWWHRLESMKKKNRISGLESEWWSSKTAHGVRTWRHSTARQDITARTSGKHAVFESWRRKARNGIYASLCRAPTPTSKKPRCGLITRIEFLQPTLDSMGRTVNWLWNHSTLDSTRLKRTLPPQDTRGWYFPDILDQLSMAW
jgi:hypothetical protein